jgi:hypothetical protein
MLPIGLIIVLTFSPADEAWKTKRVADWTEQETKEVLTNSPWAVVTTPTVKREEKKSHGGGVSGVGGAVGIPGMGRHRGNDPNQDSNNTPAPTDSAPPLTLRWESALPIREAELKAREINAPVVEEQYYGIAVYGLPSHFVKDPQNAGDRLKGQATIKRDGQKDLKPSHVDVIQRDEGVVVVFLFPRTKEITAKDSRIVFEAMVGPYQISQSFRLDEMTYQGKMEL